MTMEALRTLCSDQMDDYDIRRLDWDLISTYRPELCRTTMLEF